MIRSVVEVIAVVVCASIGVALVTLGVEFVEYGSVLQILLVVSAAVVLSAVAIWSAWRIFYHEYPFHPG